MQLQTKPTTNQLYKVNPSDEKGLEKNWLNVTLLFSIHISAFGKGSKSQEIIVACLFILPLIILNIHFQ